MTIRFVTPGHINLDAAFTFGVSAKESGNPIGFFGTGLKYAVATLLRTGHQIKVYIGTELHEFSRVEIEHRDRKFTTVCLVGKSLNFTTDLSRQWEVWMAFRELHSNTLDESGITTAAPEQPEEGKTIIEVNGDGIDAAFRNKAEVFCESAVLAENGTIEVRSGAARGIFYRGVFVSNLPRQTVYTYNLLSDQKLTEDRTLADTWVLPMRLAKYLSTIPNRDILARVLTAPHDTFEGKLDFDTTDAPGEDFIAVLMKLQHDRFLNLSARNLLKRLGLLKEAVIELDEIQAEQLDRSRSFLAFLGFKTDIYPIAVCELNGALGEARDGVIYLSPKAFRMGTKYVASTLLEEFLHLSEGVRDETREMQNLLIDTIMTLGEKVVGHPI